LKGGFKNILIFSELLFGCCKDRKEGGGGGDFNGKQNTDICVHNTRGRFFRLANVIGQVAPMNISVNPVQHRKTGSNTHVPRRIPVRYSRRVT